MAREARCVCVGGGGAAGSCSSHRWGGRARTRKPSAERKGWNGVGRSGGSPRREPGWRPLPGATGKERPAGVEVERREPQDTDRRRREV